MSPSLAAPTRLLRICDCPLDAGRTCDVPTDPAALERRSPSVGPLGTRCWQFPSLGALVAVGVNGHRGPRAQIDSSRLRSRLNCGSSPAPTVVRCPSARQALTQAHVDPFDQLLPAASVRAPMGDRLDGAPAHPGRFCAAINGKCPLELLCVSRFGQSVPSRRCTATTERYASHVRAALELSKGSISPMTDNNRPHGDRWLLLWASTPPRRNHILPAWPSRARRHKSPYVETSHLWRSQPTKSTRGFPRSGPESCSPCPASERLGSEIGRQLGYHRAPDRRRPYRPGRRAQPEEHR